MPPAECTHTCPPYGCREACPHSECDGETSRCDALDPALQLLDAAGRGVGFGSVAS